MLNTVKNKSKFSTQCSRFIQLSLLLITCNTLAKGEVNKDLSLFKSFNPQVEVKLQDRTPQSFYADVDFAPKPEEYKTFLDYVFVYDHAGVLQRMSNHYHRMMERDEYVRNWDLSSTTMHRLSTIDERKRYFNKNFIKYIDKRLSGSIKKAKKGSTMAQVGQMKETLTPQSEAQFSKNFKVKFRAKVLKGLAIVKFDNPFVDANTYLSLSDGLMMQVKKKFSGTRTVASVDYYTAGTNIEFYVEQGLTSRLSARASAKDIVGGSDASHELRLNYSAPFNF